MLETAFRKEENYHYMILDCENPLREGYENQMMEFCEVPGFLQYELRELNGRQQIHYKMNYRTTLKSVMNNLPFTKSRLTNMINSIIHVLDIANEYLLDAENIIWDEHAIFVEADTGKLEFCYLPCEQSYGTLQELLLKIMQLVDKKEEDAFILILQFYNLITEPNCSLEKIKKYRRGEIEFAMDYPHKKEDALEKEQYEDKKKMNIEKKKEQKDVTSKKAQIVWFAIILVGIVNLILIGGLFFNLLTYTSMFFLLIGLFLMVALIIVYMNCLTDESPDQIMHEYFETHDKEAYVSGKEGAPEWTRGQDNQMIANSQGIKVQSNETTLLTEENTAVDCVVVEEREKALCLKAIEKEKYSPIYLEKNSVVIGNLSEGCDYILNTKGVSRMHAKIYKKMGEHYVLDLNSTNGTYLNGQILTCGEAYKLEEGDMISFAQCEFYVEAME